MFYTPDPARPATGYEWYESKAARITWQASARNKFNFLVDRQRNCNCHGNVAATTSVNPPESTLGYHFDPDALYQVTWNSPRTSRLLLEAGAGAAWQSWPAEMQPGVTAERHFHHRAVDRHDLQLVADLQRDPGRSPLHAALFPVVRHRIPQLQDRVPARGGDPESQHGSESAT